MNAEREADSEKVRCASANSDEFAQEREGEYIVGKQDGASWDWETREEK